MALSVLCFSRAALTCQSLAMPILASSARCFLFRMNPPRALIRAFIAAGLCFFGRLAASAGMRSETSPRRCSYCSGVMLSPAASKTTSRSSSCLSSITWRDLVVAACVAALRAPVYSGEVMYFATSFWTALLTDRSKTSCWTLAASACFLSSWALCVSRTVLTFMLCDKSYIGIISFLVPLPLEQCM